MVFEYTGLCHCIGWKGVDWKATNRIFETMPEKFIQTDAGTVFNF
jgi:hypothetical protein